MLPLSREQARLADAHSAEQRLAKVLESISEGFIALDRHWVYTALNDYACARMDRLREEVLGRCIWDLHPEAVGTYFEAQLRRAALEQQRVQFDYFCPPRGRWYENRVYPAGDGVWLFFTEITDRKRAEEALIVSQKRLAADLGLMKTLQELSTRLVRDSGADAPLREIIDAAIDITDADMGNIQMLDHDGRALRIAASRGFTQPCLQFLNAVHDGRSASCGHAMECGARVIVDDVTTSSEFAGTPTRDVLLAAGVRALQSTPLLSRSGQLLGLLNTHYATARVPEQRDLHLLDVLARQAADWIERTQTQEKLHQAKQALEEADRRKNELLAMLAHELRNPLASILAGSRLLRRLSPGAFESQETRDMIEQQVARLTRLVDNLLDVSRIATGCLVLHREPIDVRDAVHRAVETLRPSLSKRGHGLHLDIAAESILVDGDIVRLVQVFSDLLSNAMNCMSTAGAIHVAAAVENGQAVVRVRPVGIGVAAEDLTHLFDAFHGTVPRANRVGELGVDLMPSRQVIELHQGSLEAFGDGFGRGTEFLARLPLSKGVPTAGPEQLPAAGGRQVSGAHRILIVDDNESFASAMTGLLKAMGHEARAIHDGAAAVATVRAFRPLVVLLDVDLPGRRGYDIAREIRSDPLITHTLLVAVTGFGQERDRLEAQRAGFDHHLTKPLDENAIEKLIDDALASARA
jgi:signal transduction histidine kinase/ActR/RegA family two-component response regulator/PAS domain-containing protein